jgi:hypothetical protein
MFKNVTFSEYGVGSVSFTEIYRCIFLRCTKQRSGFVKYVTEQYDAKHNGKSAAVSWASLGFFQGRGGGCRKSAYNSRLPSHS